MRPPVGELLAGDPCQTGRLCRECAEYDPGGTFPPGMRPCTLSKIQTGRCGRERVRLVVCAAHRWGWASCTAEPASRSAAPGRRSAPAAACRRQAAGTVGDVRMVGRLDNRIRELAKKLSDEQLIAEVAANKTWSYPWHEMEMQRRLKDSIDALATESRRGPLVGVLGHGRDRGTDRGADRAYRRPGRPELAQRE